jgi:outer membrane protein assembly factor BamA
MAAAVDRPWRRWLPLLALMGACAVLDPDQLAERSSVQGRQPVRVIAEFSGNSALSDRELKLAVEDYLFDLSRDPTREAAIYDAALEIEDLYRTSGYPSATVQYEYEPPPAEGEWPSRVRPQFKIVEGPMICADLVLVGNLAYPRRQLLSLWRRHDSGLFGLGPPVFVEAQVRAFATDLQAFYRADGRLDAELLPPRIDVDLQ